ncbi:MAG: hypothetical protein C0602_08540 [Denitrovibrio sp.]|nr:MAG: hypothetical protein C0602_08540 [Denitrovibrio sp.]
MIIRYNKDSEGIIEYLKTGKMQGREQQREELDRRVHLLGDLDVTETIIKDIKKNKSWQDDGYLHITLSFGEEMYEKLGVKPNGDQEDNEFDIGIMKKIAEEAKRFFSAGFKVDDVNVYAEAHIPRLRSYKDKTTSEEVRRYPHIHMIIPQVHLPSGNKLIRCEKTKKDEREMVEANDAFKELINIKYGLTSPKTNRRLFNNRGEIIGRYKEGKGDIKQKRSEAKTRINEKIINQMKAGKISSQNELINYLSRHEEISKVEVARWKGKTKLKAYLDYKHAPLVFDGYMHQTEFFNDPEKDNIIDRHIKGISSDNIAVATSNSQLKSDAEYRKILSSYYKKRGAQVRKRYHSSTPPAQRQQKLKEHLKEHERSQLKKSLTPSQADQFKEAAIREYDQLASLYKDMKLLNASSQKLWDNAEKLRNDLYGGTYRSPKGRPLKLTAPPADDYGSDLVQNLLIGSANLLLWTARCFATDDKGIKKEHLDNLYIQMRSIKLKKEELKREIDRIRSEQAQREKESYVSMRQKLERGGSMTCKKDFKTACERDLTKYENAKKIEMVRDQVISIGADLYQVVAKDREGSLKRYKSPVNGAELYCDDFLGELKTINLDGNEILIEPRSSEYIYKMSDMVPVDKSALKRWDSKYEEQQVCINVACENGDYIYFKDIKADDNTQSDYIHLNGFLNLPWDRTKSSWVNNICNLPRLDQGEEYIEPDILKGKKLELPSAVDDLEEYFTRAERSAKYKQAAPEVQEEIRKKSQLFWAIYRCEIPDEILMDYLIKPNRYQGTVTYERPDLGYKIVDRGDRIALAGETVDIEKQVRLMFEIALKKGWKLELIHPLPESTDEFADALYKVQEELLTEQTDEMFNLEKEAVPELEEGVEIKQSKWKERGLEKNPERYRNKNSAQAKLDRYEEVQSLEDNKRFLKVIKETLDPQVCLDYATVKYGLNKETYKINGRYIIHNNKKYNIVDFFSKHCQMRFQDVTPLLKEISKDNFVMPEPGDFEIDLSEQ